MLAASQQLQLLPTQRVMGCGRYDSGADRMSGDLIDRGLEDLGISGLKGVLAACLAIEHPSECGCNMQRASLQLDILLRKRFKWAGTQPQCSVGRTPRCLSVGGGHASKRQPLRADALGPN